MKEVEDSSSISSQEDSDEPFELKVEEYSTSLQLVYHLLLRNTEVVDPDMRYNMFEALFSVDHICPRQGPDLWALYVVGVAVAAVFVVVVVAAVFVVTAAVIVATANVVIVLVVVVAAAAAVVVVNVQRYLSKKSCWVL